MNQKSHASAIAGNPPGFSDKPDYHAVLEVSFSYLLAGERPEVLNAMLESAAQHLLADGLITGHTQAEVSGHVINVMPMSPAAANLNEEQLAKFVHAQVESGRLNLQDLVSQMARLALTHPAKVREEFAERMGLD